MHGQASRLGVVEIGEVWKGDAIVVKEVGFEGVDHQPPTATTP